MQMQLWESKWGKLCKEPRTRMKGLNWKRQRQMEANVKWINMWKKGKEWKGYWGKIQM